MNKCEFYLNAKIDSTKVVNHTMYDHLLNDGVLEYHQSLKNYEVSPLVSLSSLAKELGVANVFVKDESSRLELNSFKILGVSYVVNEIVKKKQSGIVFATATEGNHGRALARAARLTGSKSVIFVPETIDPIKLKFIEAEDATVEVVAGDYDEAVSLAALKSKENNWILIQDTSFDNYTEIPLSIMAGYTTIFKEIEEQLQLLEEKIDVLFLQAGVGSFAGAAVYYYRKYLSSYKPQIVIVEPLLADGCLQSMQHGHVVQTQNQGETIMKGLNCRTPSQVAWPILQYGADAFLTIPDYYAQIAFKKMNQPIGEDELISAGYSGAAGLGGMLALKQAPELNSLKNFLSINEKTNILVINTEHV